MMRFSPGLLLATVCACFHPQAFSVTAIQPLSRPWLRLGGEAANLRIDKNAKYVAYSEPKGTGLKIVAIKSGKVFAVTKQNVDQSYFWAPDGLRLFYREMLQTKDHQVKSILKAYDMAKGKSVQLDEYAGVTGYLTFDPRDLRMHLFNSVGVQSKRIYFPDERLAQWQIAQRTDNGRYVATQNGIIWLSNGGYSLQKIEGDNAAVESFDLSPDGTSMVWASAKENVFVSRNGEEARLVGQGKDPRWHPSQSLILFAAAKKIGKKSYDYDLRVEDLNGSGKFLLVNPEVKERWPCWHPQGNKVYYSRPNTTDLYAIDFKN